MSAALDPIREKNAELALWWLQNGIVECVQAHYWHALETAAFGYAHARKDGDPKRRSDATKKLQAAALAWADFCDERWMWRKPLVSK